MKMDGGMNKIEKIYIIYFTFKDEDRKLNELPLNSYETDIEARAFRDGYMDAIINHTSNAKRSEVMGLFSIRTIDNKPVDEVVNNKKSKEKE